MESLKALLLLLFVVVAPACADSLMSTPEGDIPMCEVKPLVSTFIVDCFDGTVVCRDSRGDLQYNDCLLNEATPEAPSLVHCVASCD